MQNSKRVVTRDPQSVGNNITYVFQRVRELHFFARLRENWNERLTACYVSTCLTDLVNESIFFVFNQTPIVCKRPNSQALILAAESLDQKLALRLDQSLKLCRKRFAVSWELANFRDDAVVSFSSLKSQRESLSSAVAVF